MSKRDEFKVEVRLESECDSCGHETVGEWPFDFPIVRSETYWLLCLGELQRYLEDHTEFRQDLNRIVIKRVS